MRNSVRSVGVRGLYKILSVEGVPISRQFGYYACSQSTEVSWGFDCTHTQSALLCPVWLWSVVCL